MDAQSYKKLSQKILFFRIILKIHEKIYFNPRTFFCYCHNNVYKEKMFKGEVEDGRAVVYKKLNIKLFISMIAI